MFRAAVLIVALVAPAAFAAGPSWIEESNRHAQILLDVMARYNAESAASFGVEGHDSEIFDLKRSSPSARRRISQRRSPARAVARQCDRSAGPPRSRHSHRRRARPQAEHRVEPATDAAVLRSRAVGVPRLSRICSTRASRRAGRRRR